MKANFGIILILDGYGIRDTSKIKGGGNHQSKKKCEEILAIPEEIQKIQVQKTIDDEQNAKNACDLGNAKNEKLTVDNVNTGGSH